MIFRTTVLLLLSAAVINAAIAERPPDAHCAAGIKAFEADDYSTAAAELAAAMKVHPDAKTALYLGNSYLKLEQLDKSKEAFQQVLQIDPQTPKRNDILTLIRNIDARNVGIVKLISAPAGATVYLHAKAKRAYGKTPLKLSLPSGMHRVIAELKGYETVARDIKVSFGETAKIEFALRPAVCALALLSTTPGCQADVNGIGAVKVPARIRVGQGDHRVVFSAQGFQSQTVSARCEGGSPGEVLKIKAQLARPKRHMLGGAALPPGGALRSRHG